MKALSHLVSFYLHTHLPTERGASPNTTDSYSYALKFFLLYVSKRLKTEPSRLQLEQLDAPMVQDFLAHLESERGRGNSPATRNIRLAALKAFMRFVQYQVPSSLEQVQRILAIPSKRTDKPVVSYLNKQEAEALFDAPDPTTRHGLRDQAMLLLATELGLRVSELVGLRLDDVTLSPSPKLLIRGKGRRERALPLSGPQAQALRAWLAVRGPASVPELFLNARGLNMTRSGFEYILAKNIAVAAEACPSLLNKRVSPHTLRHTCAMSTLRATGNIHKVSLWLGHANHSSTEKYLHTEPAEKLEILEALGPGFATKKGRFRATDRLIAEIDAATLCGQRRKAQPMLMRR